MGVVDSMSLSLSSSDADSEGLSASHSFWEVIPGSTDRGVGK